MQITKENEDKARATKFIAKEDGKPIGRAYLYILFNDLHEEPFGFMEDVFVEEEYRGQGIGKQLIEALIVEAKEQGCYKLIGTSRMSRPKVHEL